MHELYLQAVAHGAFKPVLIVVAAVAVVNGLVQMARPVPGRLVMPAVGFVAGAAAAVWLVDEGWPVDDAVITGGSLIVAAMALDAVGRLLAWMSGR